MAVDCGLCATTVAERDILAHLRLVHPVVGELREAADAQVVDLTDVDE